MFAKLLQTGQVPDNIVGATIGPMQRAQWLTLACLILRIALSTSQPNKKLSKLITFLVNFYIPVWFRIKFSPHCQSGAVHLHYMVVLAWDLERTTREIVQKVLYDNSYFAHPENIIIVCLADPRKEV